MSPFSPTSWSRPLKRRARLWLAGSGLRPIRVALRHRGLRPSDVVLASYPRSGNTWLRFLLYDVLTQEDPSFAAVARDFPYVGAHMGARALLPGDGRLIKTHEPYLPRFYRRGVYLVRDVRAVVLSEHSFQTMHGLVRLDFDRFLDEFLRGSVHGLGSWGDHVTRWLESGLPPEDLLILRFEELREKPAEALARVVSHLGVQPDAERNELALARNTVARMREKEDAADLGKSRQDLRHVNVGATTSWHERLTPGQVARIEQRWGSLLERLGYALTEFPTSGGGVEG